VTQRVTGRERRRVVAELVLLQWRDFSLPPFGKVAVNAAERREQTDEVLRRAAAGCCEVGRREDKDLIHRLRRSPFSNGIRLRAEDCVHLFWAGGEAVRYYKPRLKALSRTLRKQMTRQECHLWYDYLCGYSMSFQRQKPILGYIVDFYCAGAQLAVELDGSQHYEPEQVVYDRQRSSALVGAGVAVLRFTNRQVDQSFSAVCEQIDQVVQARIGARHKRPETSSTACDGPPFSNGRRLRAGGCDAAVLLGRERRRVVAELASLRWWDFNLSPLGKVAVNAAKRREQTDEVLCRAAAGCCEVGRGKNKDLIHRLRRSPFSNGRRLKAGDCSVAALLGLCGWVSEEV